MTALRKTLQPSQTQQLHQAQTPNYTKHKGVQVDGRSCTRHWLMGYDTDAGGEMDTPTDWGRPRHNPWLSRDGEQQAYAQTATANPFTQKIT